MADSKQWLLTYDQTEADLAVLSDRVKQVQAGGPKKYDSDRLLKGANEKIRALESSLEVMESQPSKYLIGEGEINRRRGNIVQLKKLAISIEDALSGKTSRTRRELLAATGRSGAAAEESDSTRNMSSAELAQQQQQQMKQQDDGLDAIERGVNSLKDLGHGMSAELDLHKKLLGDLENQIDKTDQAFQNNTKRIDVVQEEDGSGAMGCGIMLCMLLLLVLIVFLASSNQACHIFKPSKC